MNTFEDLKKFPNIAAAIKPIESECNTVLHIIHYEYSEKFTPAQLEIADALLGEYMRNDPWDPDEDPAECLVNKFEDAVRSVLPSYCEIYENMTLEELARQTIENRPEEYAEWKGMAGALAMEWRENCIIIETPHCLAIIE